MLPFDVAVSLFFCLTVDSPRVVLMAQVIRQVVRILEDGGSGACRLGAQMGSGVEFADEVCPAHLCCSKRERGAHGREEPC